MTAVLHLGAALHIDPALIAEIIPAVESTVMAELNKPRD